MPLATPVSPLVSDKPLHTVTASSILAPANICLVPDQALSGLWW